MEYKYIIISDECYLMPVAKHLIDEGRDVTVGFIKDRASLRLPDFKDTETPEDKKERISVYDGILPKKSLGEVMSFLKTVKNKDDYFVLFDYNDAYKIAEMVLKMGFRNGLFPTEFYYRLEKDRVLAKKFVERYYKGIKVGEYQDFKKIVDGIKKIEESDELFCLKSNGNEGKTVVPNSDNIENEKKLLIDTLQKYKKEYEQGGFTLEKKIPDCLEVTPIIVFYNGVPVYSLAEFENKQYGAGNIGAQKGGNQCLSIRTELDCKLNKIAFPEIIYSLAKKQPGLAIYDCGLLYDGKDFYFGEFCGMRYGFDGLYAEIVMRDEGKPFVADYWEDIIAGKSPIKNKYGAALRLFNYEGNSIDTEDPKSGIPMLWDKSIENNLFIYQMKKEKGEIVDTAGKDFIATMTGSSDNMEEAVKEMYNRVDKFYFEKLYMRPMFDFLSNDYNSSILNRIKAMEKYL